MGIRLFHKLRLFSYVPELGLFQNRLSIVEKGVYQVFRSSSLALMPDDRDVDFPSPVIETFGESKVTRSRIIDRKVCRVVVTVLKTLNFSVARLVRFPSVVKKSRLYHSEESFKIVLHIYAIARMEREVYSLLRDFVSHYHSLGDDHLLEAPLPLDSFNDSLTSGFILEVLVKVFAANKLLYYSAAVFFKAKEADLELSKKSCNFLLKCLAEARIDHLFYCILEEMKRSGPLPNVYTYTIMIDFYCKGHNLKGEDMDCVIEIMFSMRECPTVVTCGALIHGLCRVGRVECALKFIYNMRQKNENLNSYSYNAVIRELCKRGEKDKALLVLEDMKWFEISPDVYTYSILVEGFSQSGDIERGRSLIEEMKAYHLKPSIVTYTSFLKGFFKRGLLKESLEFFNSLSDFGHYEYDKTIYNISINSFCKLGSFDVAYELLKEMISNNLVPDACHVNSLIYWVCKRSNSKETLTFYEYLLNIGVSPDRVTYTILIDMFCKENRLDKACDLFNEMSGNGLKPDYKTWTCIINGYCNLGHVKEASILFNDMEQSGHKPNVVTYTCLIKGYCMINKMDNAHWLFDRMRSKGVLPDSITYEVLIRNYQKHGQFVKADELFKEMRENEGRDTSTNRYAYSYKRIMVLAAMESIRNIFTNR